MSLACEFMMDSYQQALFQVKSIFSHEKIVIFLSFFFLNILTWFFSLLYEAMSRLNNELFSETIF